LVELVVVAAVLTVLAGLVLYRAGDATADARIEATLLSAVAIRDAICGARGDPGFLGELGEAPRQMADLFRRPALLPSGRHVPLKFDPFTGRGWNGPYLLRSTGTYAASPPRHFTSLYGDDGDPCVIDAWGQPIVLQWPTEAGLSLDERQSYARLVSAGPDGVLTTSPGALAPDLHDSKQVGDDIVVYLFRANGP
jgi:type II secretory pathway pseudopilin PulG